jgi:hypothetical protein
MKNTPQFRSEESDIVMYKGIFLQLFSLFFYAPSFFLFIAITMDFVVIGAAVQWIRG